LQGLRANDWIVLNPADSLEEGQQVNVKEANLKSAAPASPSAAPSSKENANPLPAGKSK